ncbi:MAG: hypothetical protein OEV15_04095 [Gallionella sp.]|nr:hypothetical protein [Gallionella sp.]
MFELNVYYDDVLRYAIIGNWGKVQELRDQGFYVQVKEIPRSKLNWAEGERPDHFMSIDDAIIYHEDEFGLHELAELRPAGVHYRLGFY